LTELGDDGDLTFLNNKEAARQPQHHRRCGDDTQTNFRLSGCRAARAKRSAAVSATALATKQTAKTIVEIAPNLI
jgi:hypothetical protein